MSVQRVSADIRRTNVTNRLELNKYESHTHHHWHCPVPDCDCCDCCGGSKSCFYMTLFIGFVIVIAVIIAMVSDLSQDDSDSGGGSSDDHVADTSYSDNETRLLTVSSFFKGQVGISSSDHYVANATLYLLRNEAPPLSSTFSSSESTTIPDTDPFDDDDDFYSWHYYLHRGSNVSLQACVGSDQCNPYHIYIVKGPQNFLNWRNSLNVKNRGEDSLIITKLCDSYQELNYTIKADDHYYFFYYPLYSYCDSYDSGSSQVSIYVNKYEYTLYLTSRVKNLVTHTSSIPVQ